MPGPGIAYGQSVAAGVEAGDLDPDELAQHRIDRAFARERAPVGGERFEHDRILRVGPRARGRSGLLLRILAEVADLRVDLVDAQRLDPRHRPTPFPLYSQLRMHSVADTSLPTAGA